MTRLSHAAKHAALTEVFPRLKLAAHLCVTVFLTIHQPAEPGTVRYLAVPCTGISMYDYVHGVRRVRQGPQLAELSALQPAALLR